MADIFLSYAREDLERARSLAEALTAEGWDVFWDRRIPPGRTFEDYIEQQIRNCRALVVLWSPAAVASTWVKIEAAKGRDRNILIPALIGDADIPFGYEHLNAADLRAWRAGFRGLEFEDFVAAIEGHVLPKPRARTAREAPLTPAGPPDLTDESTKTHLGDQRRAGLPLAPILIAAVAVLTAVAMFALSRSGSEPGRSSTPTVTTAPAPALSDEFVVPLNPFVSLVKIPAGSFLMGSDKKKDPWAEDNELWPGGAQGSMNLPDFYIGKYEATVAQFRACVDANGCSPLQPFVEPVLSNGWRGLGTNPDHPVVNVSWDEALQYCAWLEKTIKESSQAPAELKTLLANGWRVSLPSEAEWERAARGTDGRRFPWGEEIGPDRANYEDARRGGTTPVASFPRGASPYGVLDMSGNVWEWTRSGYEPYPYVASDGREALKARRPRAVRGGSFPVVKSFVRAAVRNYSVPDERGNNAGFRVVVSRF